MSTQTLPSGPFEPKRVQAQVISALAAGASITAAANSSGIHRSTIHNWLKSDPQFSAALDSARADYTEALRDQLRDLAALALQTIHDILADPKASPSVRLKAALAVLNRPRFPEHGWTLPEPLESPERQRYLRDHADLHLEYQDLCRQQALDRAHKGEQKAIIRQDSTLFDTNPEFVDPPSPPNPANHSVNEPEQKACEEGTNLGPAEPPKCLAPPEPASAPKPNSIEKTAKVRHSSTVFDTKTQTVAPPKRLPARARYVSRNANCPCGSGKKFKRCCGSVASPLLAA